MLTEKNYKEIERICSFKELYRGARKCKLNVIWKDSVSGYINNGLVNIHKLKEALDDGTYTLDKYQCFTIYEPKMREIISTRFKDRVFQRSLCDNYLYNALTKSFIHTNCACQIGKGTEFARKKLKAYLQKYCRQHNRSNEGYVLKVDLKNYFGSTPHELAYQAVEKRVDNDWVLFEIKRIIDSYNQCENPNVGMGLGSQTTQLIQLAILDDLDHIIKERLHIKFYIRYMDDLILIHDNKEHLKYCLSIIGNWLLERSLNVNKKKTQLFKVRQGIIFLGFKFKLIETGKVVMTLSPAKISHERRKLKKLVELCRQERLTKSEVDNCYTCWRAYINNETKSKRKNAKRDCHNLILAMDRYYKNLWEVA